jgi:hypothetical protein
MAYNPGEPNRSLSYSKATTRRQRGAAQYRYCYSLQTTVVANMLQSISASVILDVSEDEPDLASPAGLECAVDDCDITPVIGCKLLHE